MIPDPAGTGAALADIVIEAISEQPEAKLALYRALEPRMKPDAVLATNTSSLSLKRCARDWRGPSVWWASTSSIPWPRCRWWKWCTPTARPMLARASAFVGQIDKLALPVKSAPGFLVNAVLAPSSARSTSSPCRSRARPAFWSTRCWRPTCCAMRSVDAGVAPAAIDAAWWPSACRWDRWNWPTPWAWTRPRRRRGAGGGQEPPRCLADRLSRGQLGRKTGQGFYAWRDGKPSRTRRPSPPPASRPA